MTAEQEALFERAYRALETARVNLGADDAPVAVNRAYYAVYYAATAALLDVGETPRSHQGLHARFYLQYVATYRLPSSLGDTLRAAFRLRQRADYEALSIFDISGTADLINDAEHFVRAVEVLLPKSSG